MPGGWTHSLTPAPSGSSSGNKRWKRRDHSISPHLEANHWQIVKKWIKTIQSCFWTFIFCSEKKLAIFYFFVFIFCVFLAFIFFLLKLETLHPSFNWPKSCPEGAWLGTELIHWPEMEWHASSSCFVVVLSSRKSPILTLKSLVLWNERKLACFEAILRTRKCFPQNFCQFEWHFWEIKYIALNLLRYLKSAIWKNKFHWGRLQYGTPKCFQIRLVRTYRICAWLLNKKGWRRNCVTSKSKNSKQKLYPLAQRDPLEFSTLRTHSEKNIFLAFIVFVSSKHPLTQRWDEKVHAKFFCFVLPLSFFC